MKFFRTCLATTLVVAAALASATSANAPARPPVYVAAHCGGMGSVLSGHAIRPRTIYFACGGTLMLYFDDATYSSWGGRTATGRGIVSYQACSAACSNTYRHEPGTFTLSDIQRCSDGRLYYTKAVAHAPGVPASDFWDPSPESYSGDCTTPPPGTIPTGTPSPSPGQAVPVLGRTIVLTFVSGVVTYLLPGRAGFEQLTSGSVLVPVGTEIDVIDGTVLVIVSAGSGTRETATVYGGEFIVRQGAMLPYATNFVLSEPLTGCPGFAASAAGASRRKAKQRRLWVTDNGGSFGTTGRYAATTVEGTKWLTTDTCSASSVSVAEGVVVVLDLVTHQTAVVHAGQHYRAPKHGHPIGPLAVLESYWSAIEAHAFAVAYGYLVPGAIPQTEPEFVAFEQHENIENVEFRGNVTAMSPTSATVAVVSLVTNDHQFGCRTWSGSYAMTHGSGGWRIASANITPKPCGG